MNRSPDFPTDADLDAALRTLDAAQPRLTTAQHARADALLSSLTSGGRPLTPTVSPLSRRRRPVVRWLLPAAAASALVLGALVWPGSPVVPAAYADWTPQPAPVDEPLLSQVTGACRAGMQDWNRDGVTVDPAAAQVVVAEQRGSHVFLALASDTGADAQCMASAETGRISGLTGGAPSDGFVPEVAPPTGLTGGGVGVQLEGTSGYAYMVGRAGDQVRQVVVHSGGKSVTATVTDGHYAAWWPVSDMDPRSVGAIDATVDVTLADGTVVTNVETSLDRTAGRRPGPTEVGRISTGGGTSAAGDVRTIEGLAGARVRAVTVHVAGADHQARVKGGTFHAEWPVAALEKDAVSPATFTLTLDDGTVLEKVAAVS